MCSLFHSQPMPTHGQGMTAPRLDARNPTLLTAPHITAGGSV